MSTEDIAGHVDPRWIPDHQRQADEKPVCGRLPVVPVWGTVLETKGPVATESNRAVLLVERPFKRDNDQQNHWV